MPRRPRYLVPAALPLRELTRLHCVETLKYTKGDKTRCAKRLGISRHQVYDLLKEYAAEPIAAPQYVYPERRPRPAVRVVRSLNAADTLQMEETAAEARSTVQRILARLQQQRA